MEGRGGQDGRPRVELSTQRSGIRVHVSTITRFAGSEQMITNKAQFQIKAVYNFTLSICAVPYRIKTSLVSLWSHYFLQEGKVGLYSIQITGSGDMHSSQ